MVVNNNIDMAIQRLILLLYDLLRDEEIKYSEDLNLCIKTETK